MYQALESLKNAGKHEAIVIDEYGGIEGFVTLHDIVENIVGDMPEREDEAEPHIIERTETSWLADGLVSIDTFLEYFGLEKTATDIENKRYNTLGGLITNSLGNIPRVKDTIQIEDLVLEVVDMDQFRVDKVLISKQEKTEDI